jgi:hypothetical protein
MAAQVQGNATSEKAQEKARAMSISTNDPKFNTPLIPASAATLIVHASTRVDAPASLVFRTLRNTETWRDWNNFVPRVTIRSQPKEDIATDTEIQDLILNTSYLVSIDSDLTEGGGLAAKKPAPPPAATSIDTFRRPSVASGKSGDSLSGAQRFQQSQAARKASTASGMSGKSGVSPATAPASSDTTTTTSPRPASPAPAKLVETSSPTTGGVLIHHGNSANGRKAAHLAQTRRRSSLNAMYGEPSVRLKEHTAMTFHCRMGLPLQPASYKDMPLIVTEVSRPDDVANGWDSPNEGLTRSNTHTLSRSGVYRIVWGTDHKVDKQLKFMLTTQWVVEVRPVVRGDGKEECEITIWESLKGLSAGGIKKRYQGYLFDMFTQWVLGLRDHCEAMGGAVERRDFIMEHAKDGH